MSRFNGEDRPPPWAHRDRSSPYEIAWMPPYGNLLKMNIDVAANFQDKILGNGAVVRNYKGEVIAAFSKSVQSCFRSDEIEAKTLFYSLNWATQQQLPIAHVKTDALRVSSALNSLHRDLSCFSDLIDDVRCLLSSFLEVTGTHAHRQANQAACGLAKISSVTMLLESISAAAIPLAGIHLSLRCCCDPTMDREVDLPPPFALGRDLTRPMIPNSNSSHFPRKQNKK
uniref:RNase H type-1 domain-containing protein n=1 Tax=Cannabis sativa TaxID=3483 RepID=A0A803NQ78_CANSA